MRYDLLLIADLRRNFLQKSLEQLIQFYETPMGACIYGAESKILKHYLPHFFGYFLVQIGGPAAMDWLKNSPIRHHYRYADILPTHHPAKADCFGDLTQLPFPADSIDLFFLPHTLDLSADMHSMLAEIDRCLIPEGALLLFNFVPYRYMYYQKKFRQVLSDIHWHSYSQLRQSLVKHNLDIENVKTFFFRPYRQETNALKRLQFLETLGQAICPWFGNIQMVIARKKRFPMTPIINPVRKRRPLLINNEVAPTARTRS